LINLRYKFDQIIKKYGYPVTLVNIGKNQCPICGNREIKGCEACYGTGKTIRTKEIKTRSHVATNPPVEGAEFVKLVSVGELQYTPIIFYFYYNEKIKVNDLIISDGIIYEIHLLFKERLKDGRIEYIWTACKQKPSKQQFA